MWRAFGGNAARVAIVFRVPYYSAGAQALNIMFSPVAYLTEREVHDELLAVMNSSLAGSDFLKSADRSVVLATIFNMLVTGVVCLKHEGFREEREWRVIYAPKRSPAPLIEANTKTIGGVPQIVYKLPLDVTTSSALAELDLSRMFDRLIVGPSPYPWVIFEAFVSALAKAGVMDAEKRVVVSGIPLRA
jgi:hypothetical protein